MKKKKEEETFYILPNLKGNQLVFFSNLISNKKIYEPCLSFRYSMNDKTQQVRFRGLIPWNFISMWNIYWNSCKMILILFTSTNCKGSKMKQWWPRIRGKRYYAELISFLYCRFYCLFIPEDVDNVRVIKFTDVNT